MAETGDSRPVSVVIPNYNGSELLRKCFSSVFESVCQYNENCEIIIVDDASTDDSISYIESEFPGVKILVRTENQGFIASCNHGVEEASHQVVVLLNNDIEACGDFISPAYRYFSDPDTFAVSLKSLYPDGKTFREGAKTVIVKSGLAKIRHAERHQPKPGADGRIETAYPVGGHMAVRKDYFIQLGGFDPIYSPFYWEDADLGFRAKQQGWKIYYEPDAVVIHHEQGSIKTNFQKEYIDTVKQRNRLIFTWRHLSSKSSGVFQKSFEKLRLLQAKFENDTVMQNAYKEAKRIFSNNQER